MKIHLTKKEYRLLLDILSISGWVMNSHKIEEDPKAKPYKMLEQKLMSYAKSFGFDNLVMQSKEYESYFITHEYEDLGTDREFIEEFEEEVFWEELCHRLAQRDLVDTKGFQKVKEMESIDRMSEEDTIAESYNEEFVENGIRNLKLSKG